MPDGAKPAARAAPVETTLSTKGQVVLPKAVRDRLGWRPGTKVVVEATEDGVTLRRAPPFRPTTIDEVFGSLSKYYDGPPVSVEDMDRGIEEPFRSEWGRQFDPG